MSVFVGTETICHSSDLGLTLQISLKITAQMVALCKKVC